MNTSDQWCRCSEPDSSGEFHAIETGRGPLQYHACSRCDLPIQTTVRNVASDRVGHVGDIENDFRETPCWFSIEVNPWTSPVFAGAQDWLRRKRESAELDRGRVQQRVAELSSTPWEDRTQAKRELLDQTLGLVRQIDRIDDFLQDCPEDQDATQTNMHERQEAA